VLLLLLRQLHFFLLHLLAFSRVIEEQQTKRLPSCNRIIFAHVAITHQYTGVSEKVVHHPK
jgi:hypothetical protein